MFNCEYWTKEIIGDCIVWQKPLIPIKDLLKVCDLGIDPDKQYTIQDIIWGPEENWLNRTNKKEVGQQKCTCDIMKLMRVGCTCGGI